MRFTVTVICLMTLLLVPVFGAQSKGKQRDQPTSPPPAHLSPPSAHPPAHLHLPPSSAPPLPAPQPLTHTNLPPKQPLPPPHKPVDLSKVDTYGRLVHFQVDPSFSNKKSGVILNSAPDKHGLYNIAPVNSHFKDYAGNFGGWRINRNQIVKVHKDDITKSTETKIQNVAGDILNHHDSHSPEVVHTRLNNLPAASSSNDQPGQSKSTWWGGIRDKFGRTGGRRRR